ncbi:MAG TPA: glycosyltransferase [Ktedonobacterales bacterium]
MRITIITVGTYGDIAPLVALGYGLQKHGHSVRVATHRTFADLVRACGLDFFPVHGDPQDILQTGSGQHWLRTSGNPVRFLARMRGLAKEHIRPLMVDCIRALGDTDAIVFSQIGIALPDEVLLSLHKPVCLALLKPLTQTSAYPSAHFPQLTRWPKSLAHWYNRTTYAIYLRMLWRLSRPYLQEVVPNQLGVQLPTSDWIEQRFRKQQVPVVYGYSPTLLPPPADWGTNNYVTGFWPLPPQGNWEPSQELREFVGQGYPLVYVGFGSMVDREQEQLIMLAVSALQAVGARGIIATGWNQAVTLPMPKTILITKEIPHEWLFPHMEAIVHHGGIGTFAASLRAGRPMVCVPYFSDQPFWSNLAFSLGVSPRPVPRRRLTSSNLTAALHIALRDSAMRQRARAIGEALTHEDGVASAAATINHLFTNWAE